LFGDESSGFFIELSRGVVSFAVMNVQQAPNIFKQERERTVRMPSKLVEYFNKQQRIATLSTSNKNGKVDAAVFGSPRMVDEKTVIMGLGNNRTYANLQENPQAVFMLIEPGKTIMDWKGIRVYVNMKSSATSGETLDTYKRQMAKAVGEQAANMVHAVVTFEVREVRPLVDFGQGWDKSI
jgi:hypothetical protein